MTLAAQLGVAPVLLATFGPIPLASLPANLLCVPVAGLVMVWGLTAGLLAGVLGAPWASLLHQPTRLALAWLDVVAERTARASLGELHSAHVVAVAIGLGVLALVHRPGVRAVGSTLVTSVVLIAVVSAHAPVPRREALRPGLVRWHEQDVDIVVLGGGGRTSLGGAGVLESLRRARVHTVDLLVVADPSVSESVVDLVTHAHRVGRVHGLADGATTMQVGSLVVRITSVPGRLVVDAVPRGP